MEVFSGGLQHFEYGKGLLRFLRKITHVSVLAKGSKTGGLPRGAANLHRAGSRSASSACSWAGPNQCSAVCPGPHGLFSRCHFGHWLFACQLPVCTPSAQRTTSRLRPPSISTILPTARHFMIGNGKVSSCQQCSVGDLDPFYPMADNLS